jgi:hypothetical protein
VKIACGNIARQALSACLAGSQFRGVLPRKRCVSEQRFWSAAISSKSTGSATDVAATDPVAVWFGRDKKLATTFFKPGKYNSCTLNSEMKPNGGAVWVKWGLKHEK